MLLEVNVAHYGSNGCSRSIFFACFWIFSPEGYEYLWSHFVEEVSGGLENVSSVCGVMICVLPTIVITDNL